jgi:hypothetical protein
MEIIDTLISWGINTQNENDIFDFLTLTYPQHCYYIDRFPLLVKNFEKYEKEELYYEKVLDKNVSKESFTIQESKFVNVMKKMWLYNEVLVQTDLFEVPDEKIVRVLDENNSTMFSLKEMIISKKSDTTILENAIHLDFLIKLAVRETVYSKMFFLDHKIMVIAYGMCFQVYMHDLSTLQFIKTIVSTEGLYLRPYISD